MSERRSERVSGQGFEKKKVQVNQKMTLAARCSLDRSKKEDPAHFTNHAFQPQIWQPGRDYERAGEPETSRRSSS